MHSTKPVPLAGFGPSPLVSAALAVLLLGAPGAASGHAGTLQLKAQQKCIVEMNKALAKVSKAQGKLICSCMKDGSKGKLPGTIEECLDADLKGKVAKTTARTLVKEAKRCPSDPNSPDYPDFAYTSGEVVNAAGLERPSALIHALFGSDLDAAVISRDDPNVPDAKTVSKCQLDVTKAAKKCFDTKLKVFNKCKKAGLKGKPVPGSGSIPDALDLSELCLMQGADPNTGQPDPGGKIAKTCGTKLQAKIAKKCGGVDLELAFPGLDPNADLQASIDARVECEVCRAINLADGISRDCDRFDDGLANGSCSIVLAGCSEGSPPEFDSTFDAIQGIVFEGYGCANPLCHGAANQANLDLRAGSSYDNLVGVESFQFLTSKLRVEPGDQDLSYLYELLARARLDPPFDAGGMPAVGSPITEDHLEAIKIWIRGGAPREGIVAETAEVLSSCLPEPTPLRMPVPDAPDPNVGVQLWQTSWPLPSQSESEICMATYYDFAATDLVPTSAKVPCPPEYQIPSNYSGECFSFHLLKLAQDSQSHHSIVNLYTGQEFITHPSWGPFTFKFQDPNDPLDGTPCDPADVDPNTGYNPHCSGVIQLSVACIGYGPDDFNVGLNTAPTFNISQEPLHVQEFADGVYTALPMTGIIGWNSHAFNLTSYDTTMSQYLNLEFAEPNDQLYPVIGVFDVSQIFVANVPPFETREYCNTYTAPLGSRLFRIASHTHRHGVRFRIWEPPNTPCTPSPSCLPGDPNQQIYLTIEYTDPLQLDFEPPVAHDNPVVASRTYLYCSLYDNGSTPTSPEIKRDSHPVASCSAGVRACLDGPQKGDVCNGVDAFCDSSLGAGDGECDACPVIGGITTEDEMFVILGSYYVE